MDTLDKGEESTFIKVASKPVRTTTPGSAITYVGAVEMNQSNVRWHTWLGLIELWTRSFHSASSLGPK